MRILHPRTIKIIANMEDSEFENATVTKKAILSHAWSEIFKYLATRRNHPKCFIRNEYDLGMYLGYLRSVGETVGCNMNVENMFKYDDVYQGFAVYNNMYDYELYLVRSKEYFDDNYLFSDAVSLYFKGVNIFVHIFGASWRKYVPVESLVEIQRQVSKTINKDKGGEL